MRCPVCEHTESKVIDSRDAGDTTRRRRECLECAERFTTFERIEQKRLWVVKKSGNKEPFKLDKVMEGVALACRKRPVSADHVDAMARDVEQELRRGGQTEVASSDVGEAVLTVLARVDAVAWLRFASVYRAFESVEQFVDTIRPLQERE